MCVQSVCYTKVVGLLRKCEWILVLCVLMQCLIISENKVHGDGNTIKTIQQNQHAETPGNRTSSNTAVPKQQSAGARNDHNSGNVTSSSKTLETVQLPRKIISTGAFVRAFYVFVGLGAIIVMYIAVRTVRLRRKKTIVRKYGVLASREDVELTPLGTQDEDEDMALFDMTTVKSRP